MILQQYHKSQNLTKKEAAICRFLPPSLAELLITYLSEVKEVEAYFTKLKGIEHFDHYHLFTCNGMAMTAEKIREGFRVTMEKHGVKICLSGYRFVSLRLTFILDFTDSDC